MPKMFNKNAISTNTREHRRFRSFSLLKYCLLNDPTQKTFLVNPRDVSARGASFVSDLNLPLNTILEADIYLPPLKDFVTVMANVVRVLKLKNRTQYLVGIHFRAIDPENKFRIDSYITKTAKNPSMQRYFDKKAAHFHRSFL